MQRAFTESEGLFIFWVCFFLFFLFVCFSKERRKALNAQMGDDAEQHEILGRSEEGVHWLGIVFDQGSP